MGIATNRLIKSLLGIVLLCVFMMRPCAAFVRDVNALKNLAVIEKGLEDSSKEAKETKENKGRYCPEFIVPSTNANTAFRNCNASPRRQILQEIHGCPGPILRILTPPPDAALSL